MTTDDYYCDETPETPDHDVQIPDPNWTPGASLVAIEDDGETTFFEDTDGVELLKRWVTIDAEHTVTRGEMR